MINHDSTSDHSIIGIRIIRPEIRLSSPTKGKYIRAWSKANWAEFSSYICSKNLDYSDISSKIESEKVIENLYQCIEEGINKAVPLVEMKTKYAPWWSQNLEWLLTKVRRARKRMATQRSVEANKIFANLKITWEKAVRNAKQRYLKCKLEQATNSSIWNINKRHTMVHSNAIPDLDRAIEFSDKSNKLQTTLFPASDGAISIIPENFVASQRDLFDTFTPVRKSEVK
jgi:hypothetical protein